MIAHIGAELPIDPFSRHAERHLAQRGDVPLPEKVLGCVTRSFGRVHLSFLQSPEQLIGREVDQFHIISPIKDGIGYGFQDGNARDLGYCIGPAFEMLHVQRGAHVDTVVEKLQHILVTLCVPASLSVRMRQFIDKHQRRLARQNCIDIHLFDRDPPIQELFPGKDLQAFKQGGRFRPAVGLHDTDKNVFAVRSRVVCGLQHFVRLPDAGAHAEEYFQVSLALRLLFSLQTLQEEVGIGTVMNLRHADFSR